MDIRPLFSRFHAEFRTRTGVSIVLPLLVVATFVTLFELDPFGIESASSVRSEQATLRVMSPWYRPSGLVTAVVIDDDYIKGFATGWPLRYADQGRLMRVLLAAKPAVLVIDLVYPRRHGAEGQSVKPDNPADLLTPILKPGGTIPIVFTAMAKEGATDLCPERLLPGDVADSLFDLNSMQDELRLALDAYHPNENDSRVRRAYIRWAGCQDRYPLILGGNTKTLTPAFAAYTVYCEKHRGHPQCGHAQPDLHPEDYLRPMIVRSGAFPPSTQAFAYDSETCQRLGSNAKGDVPWIERLWSTVQQLAVGVFFKDPRADANKQLSLPCPAVNIVPLSTLQRASAKDMRDLLENKAVVLGAELSGIPDVVTTPVHGQVAGVVWHAMALDNLLSLGPGYLAERHEQARHIAWIVLVVIFAYVFPFIVWLIEHRIVKIWLASISLAVWCTLALVHLSVGHYYTAGIALAMGVALDLTKPRTSAGYFLAAFVAAGGAMISLWRGWPPGNWFGLVLVIITFSHTIKPYYLGEERKRFPHGSSILGLAARQILKTCKGIPS